MRKSFSAPRACLIIKLIKLLNKPLGLDAEKYLSFINIYFKIMAIIIKRITVIGLALFFVLLSCGFVNADGSRPVSSDVAITLTAIDLTEATHTHVAVTATVTDVDGCDGLSATAKLFRTNVANGAGCTPTNFIDCYEPVAMTQDSCSDGVAAYKGDIEVQYYADATDAGTYSTDTWSVHVIPSDAGAGTAGTDDTAEMATLLALNVSTPIAYGALALGGITADTTAFDTTVTNTGNQASIGTQVKSGAATAMTCTVGTIPVGNEKYDDVSTTVYASKIALTAGDVTVADVAATKGASSNTDTVGWGLQMPATGVDGSCAGTVVFTAL